MSRRVALLGLVWAATLLLSGCATGASGGEDADGKVTVLAAFYPLQFVAEQVGGPDVSVDNLTRAGTEPHDLELTPRQVGAIADADLVVYEKGFQPAVDEAVDQSAHGKVVEVSRVVPLQDTGAHVEADEDQAAGTADPRQDPSGDPHLWQDPTLLARIGDAVRDALVDVDPEHAADYQARAATLTTALSALDKEFATGLRTCDRRVFVTSHEAFGYLARRYGLEMIGISGLSPEAEPSPARIREVDELVRAAGVNTIFYETLVSPKVAETMARDLGVSAKVLDPIEGLSDENSSDDYFTLMRKNLAALREANGCS